VKTKARLKQLSPETSGDLVTAGRHPRDDPLPHDLLRRQALNEEMVRSSRGDGMKYITITDHSPTAFLCRRGYTGSLKRQWDEIDEVQQNVGIKILRGTRI